MPTVKLDSESHDALRELAERMDLNMTAVLREAIRQLRRELFWSGVQEGFKRLRRNKEAWEAYHTEAEEWAVLPDGLQNETKEWAELYPELELDTPVKRRRK